MPLLQVLNDISVSSGVIQSAATDANYLYTINTSPGYAVYSWLGAIQNTAQIALSSTPYGIALVTNTGSSVIVYNTTRASIVDSLNNKTDITTNILAVNNINGNQQVAGATDLQLAVSTTSTTGKMCVTNPLTATTTQISPSPISSTTAKCVIYRPDAQTWLVGTAVGTVFEMNATGGQIGTTLTLPNTPNISAPTIQTVGLSYYNNKLVVVTNYGGSLLLYLARSNSNGKNTL